MGRGSAAALLLGQWHLLWQWPLHVRHWGEAPLEAAQCMSRCDRWSPFASHAQTSDAGGCEQAALPAPQQASLEAELVGSVDLDTQEAP